MLSTILLFPLVLILAFLTAFMAYNVTSVLTVFVSRGLGFPLRRVLGLESDHKSALAPAVVSMACMVVLPLMIFLGMLWTRYGGRAELFLTGLAIVTPLWFLSRLLFVVLSGEPSAGKYPLPGETPERRGWRRFRRQRNHPTGVLARRWHTISPPEGQQTDAGMVFVQWEELRWNSVRGPHVVTSLEQVPREQVFGKRHPW